MVATCGGSSLYIPGRRWFRNVHIPVRIRVYRVPTRPDTPSDTRPPTPQ